MGAACVPRAATGVPPEDQSPLIFGLEKYQDRSEGGRLIRASWSVELKIKGQHDLFRLIGGR